ncbi:hypothetical protein EVAR_77911_1 [Eumeta japonica]|uniref:Uncharacterized protein n=1 Tax=Eumeta variegata TaxID=151549 RepID=A0A4C1XVV8_EUMVA|nr:hypothetical protein EVAR_77911_1 [Eumeta japonica]
METSMCNVQKCVEQLRRHDFINRGSAARAERGVLAEPRGSEPLAAPCPVTEIEGCAVRPVTVKVEDDGADAAACRGPHTGALIKEGDDALMKTSSNEMDDHMIKQELDIGPVVLQQKSMPHLLSPSILASPPTPCSGNGASPYLALVTAESQSKTEDQCRRDCRGLSDMSEELCKCKQCEFSDLEANSLKGHMPTPK